jgi:hypothetical protein
VKNRFQAFAFKCNLYRYAEDPQGYAAVEAMWKLTPAEVAAGLAACDGVSSAAALPPRQTLWSALVLAAAAATLF